jgi:hypothetical protein
VEKYGKATDQTHFETAVCLLRSEDLKTILSGCQMLEHLVEMSPEDNPNLSTYRYFLAEGWFRVNEFTKCRDICDAIIKTGPQDRKIYVLRACASEKVTTEIAVGILSVGAALVGTSAIIGATAVTLGYLFSRGKR